VHAKFAVFSYRLKLPSNRLKLPSNQFSYLATMLLFLLATLPLTTLSLKCYPCLEYTGPPLPSDARKTALVNCTEAETSKTCSAKETVCYETRVRYTNNSTIRERDCGGKEVNCRKYQSFPEFLSCQVTRCPAEGECETEMVESAGLRMRGAALVVLVGVIVALRI